jgi:hypothetical protein
MRIVRFSASRRLFLAFVVVLQVAVPIARAGATTVFAGSCISTGTINFKPGITVAVTLQTVTADVALTGTCAMSDVQHPTQTVTITGTLTGSALSCNSGVLGGSLTVGLSAGFAVDANFTVVNGAGAMQVVATSPDMKFALSGELVALTACPATLANWAGAFVVEDPDLG